MVQATFTMRFKGVIRILVLSIASKIFYWMSLAVISLRRIDEVYSQVATPAGRTPSHRKLKVYLS